MVNLSFVVSPATLGHRAGRVTKMHLQGHRVAAGLAERGRKNHDEPKPKRDFWNFTDGDLVCFVHDIHHHSLWQRPASLAARRA